MNSLFQTTIHLIRCHSVKQGKPYRILTWGINHSGLKYLHSSQTKSSNFDQEKVKNDGRNYYKYATILAAGGLIASFASYNGLLAFSRDDRKSGSQDRKLQQNKEYKGESLQSNKDKPKHELDDRTEKCFKLADVAQHDSLEKGVWITYKGNVYDISEFIRHHPGGSHTIMMGAGGDVEPFWQTYTVHHAVEVQNLLAKYKIGRLAAEDQRQVQEQVKDENNPYANDPKRNPLLQVHTQQPFNAETPSKLLLPTYLTPTDIFFVRNHLPVPEVDLNDYTLSICTGTDGDLDNLRVIAEFSLDELKTKFKPYSVDSVIQCSGNRRSDLKKLKEIKGLDWKVGAMGNARWTGVRLIDLLAHIGISQSDNTIRHVQMEGLDCDMTGQSYGASVSADLAFDPNKSIILAYEMNGKPLTRDHGFPLRFVAPGVTGARNVKWLGKIILSHEESNSHWQRKDYKSFSPNVDMFNIEFDKSVSIQETPVQSAICDPVDGETIVLRKVDQPVTNNDDGHSIERYFIPVWGYAYSGGGKMIIRVDVSIDGGTNWMTANLKDVPRDENGLIDFEDRNKTYSWTRWSLDVPISDELIESLQSPKRSLEILCRAFDSAYNSQPERPETVWNVRGVVNNSWHRIRLNLDKNN